MATTIETAFSQYKSNLEITDRQEALVSTRRARAIRTLAGPLTLHTEQSKVIGSWDRHTMTRYLSEGDVDAIVILNYGTHKDWDNPDGTARALDRFKGILAAEFPSATVRRDRNCVTIQFSEFRLDVVPAFKNTGGPPTLRSGRSGSGDGGRGSMAFAC